LFSPSISKLVPMILVTSQWFLNCVAQAWFDKRLKSSLLSRPMIARYKNQHVHTALRLKYEPGQMCIQSQWFLNLHQPSKGTTDFQIGLLVLILIGVMSSRQLWTYLRDLLTCQESIVW